MRLRKLGRGQSVTFIVPNDISIKIREITGKTTADAIQTIDVLHWSIQNTFQDQRRNIAGWAIQGKRYESRKHLFRGAGMTTEQAQAFLEDEDQSLATRYSPRPKDSTSSTQSQTWDVKNRNVAEIHATLQEFGIIDLDAAPLNEETEVSYLGHCNYPILISHSANSM